MSEQKLIVKYLPGVPESFSKNFMIQVAHFEPNEITLKGEGVFPRISLDLPRTPDSDDQFQEVLTKAKENLSVRGKYYPKITTERPHSGLPSSQRIPPDHVLTQVCINI